MFILLLLLCYRLKSLEADTEELRIVFELLNVLPMHQHQIIFHHLDVRDEFFAWIYTLVRADPWEEIGALLIQPRAEGQNKFLL